jgi:tetratricopeptide (TPR) repeat protein
MDLSAIADSAMILLTAGRYDESIAEAKRALEIDPSFGWAYECLGRTYLSKRQYAESIAAFERARQLDANPTILGGLGNAYGAAGRKDEALKVLGEMKELSKQRHVSAFDIARVYAGLGDKDQAFGWLERAHQERSFYMTQLTYKGLGLDEIRSDPRFGAMLKRMNLPE